LLIVKSYTLTLAIMKVKCNILLSNFALIETFMAKTNPLILIVFAFVSEKVGKI